jgi:hypothetical protein
MSRCLCCTEGRQRWWKGARASTRPTKVSNPRSNYEAHEKNGIESKAGYFRRNHWVRMLKTRSYSLPVARMNGARSMPGFFERLMDVLRYLPVCYSPAGLHLVRGFDGTHAQLKRMGSARLRSLASGLTDRLAWSPWCARLGDGRTDWGPPATRIPTLLINSPSRAQVA